MASKVFFILKNSRGKSQYRTKLDLLLVLVGRLGKVRGQPFSHRLPSVTPPPNLYVRACDVKHEAVNDVTTAAALILIFVNEEIINDLLTLYRNVDLHPKELRRKARVSASVVASSFFSLSISSRFFPRDFSKCLSSFNLK